MQGRVFFFDRASQTQTFDDPRQQRGLLSVHCAPQAWLQVCTSLIFGQPGAHSLYEHELGMLQGMSLAVEMAANCSGKFAGFTHIRPLAAWWRKHSVLEKTAQFRRDAAVPHTHRPLFDLALTIVRCLSDMVELDACTCIFLLHSFILKPSWDSSPAPAPVANEKELKPGEDA
jgi:hypothetical protein